MVLSSLFARWVYELHCGGFIMHPCGSARWYFPKFPSLYTLVMVGHERCLCALWSSIHIAFIVRGLWRSTRCSSAHTFWYLSAGSPHWHGAAACPTAIPVPPTLELDAHLGPWWSLPTFSAGHHHHKTWRWWKTNRVSFQFIAICSCSSLLYIHLFFLTSCP